MQDWTGFGQEWLCLQNVCFYPQLVVLFHLGFTGTVFSDEKVEEFVELMDEELKKIDAEGKELLVIKS